MVTSLEKALQKWVIFFGVRNYKWALWPKESENYSIKILKHIPVYEYLKTDHVFEEDLGQFPP